MKRDMDLIRDILLKIEDEGPNPSGIKMKIEGYPDDDIQNHLGLLVGKGLVKAIDVSSHDGIGWIPTELTWEGYDFIEKAKDKGIWEKAKIVLKEKGIPFSFELMKTILVQIALNQLKGAS